MDSGTSSVLRISELPSPRYRDRVAPLANVTEREDFEFHIGALVDTLARKYELTRFMQNFLMWRLRYATDADTARAIGISPQTIRVWKRDHTISTRWGRHPNFRGAYMELMEHYREVNEKTMAALAPTAIEVTKQLLNATKKTPYKNEEGEIEFAEVPDYENRFRGVQVVSNWMGEWGQKPQAPVANTYNIITAGFQELLELKKQQMLKEGMIIDGESIVIEEKVNGITIDH